MDFVPSRNLLFSNADAGLPACDALAARKAEGVRAAHRPTAGARRARRRGADRAANIETRPRVSSPIPAANRHPDPPTQRIDILRALCSNLLRIRHHAHFANPSLWNAPILMSASIAAFRRFSREAASTQPRRCATVRRRGIRRSPQIRQRPFRAPFFALRAARADALANMASGKQGFPVFLAPSRGARIGCADAAQQQREKTP